MRQQDRISYFLLVYLDPHDFDYSNRELRRHIVESYREKISFTLTMLSDWMSLVRPPWERRAGLVCTSKRFTSPAIVLICTSVSLPAVNNRIHKMLSGRTRIMGSHVGVLMGQFRLQVWDYS